MALLASAGLLPEHRITGHSKCILCFPVCVIRLQCKWRLVPSFSLVIKPFIILTIIPPPHLLPGGLPGISDLTHHE